MSIEVNKISKLFGQQTALNEVSFKVTNGEIVGFLGPNGAGKSTLMKILTGFLPADGGTAKVNGLYVGYKQTGFRANIGYLPEHNPLYPEMYIREYLLMVAGFYQVEQAPKRVAEVVGMTGLGPEVRKKIGALSKGYRQRVGLAQALIHDPSVLILDEPTSGLDPNQLGEIRNLITTISKNKTVMLSTHIMQEVEAICSRVIIINKGEIIADGATAEIKGMSQSSNQVVVFGILEHLSIDDLLELSYIKKAEPLSNNEFLVTPSSTSDIRPMLFKTAVERRWTITTLAAKQSSVESIFMEMTR
jgi:ABC-2 type transport system ATP-binding protein